MVLVLSEINCTLLTERSKSGKNYTKKSASGDPPERLISRTLLNNETFCTNFKRNQPTSISKPALVSKAEALKTSRFQSIIFEALNFQAVIAGLFVY